MKYFTTYILLLAILFSCKHKETNSTLVSNDPEETLSKNLQDNHMKLKGLTLQEALKEYQKPISNIEFELNKPNITEFRIELLNFFNEAEINTNKLVKEVTWETKTDSLITSWYKALDNKWIYVHELKYHKNDEF